MLRRLVWLALVPSLVAASGARGGDAPAELAYTVGNVTYDAACVAGAGGTGGAHRLGAIGTAAGSWSADGERFALVGRSAILVEDADGSGLRAVTRPRVASEEDGSPTWSPDGASIAFSRYTGSSRSGVWIVDVATRTERQISGRYADALSWSPDGGLIAADFGYDGPREIGLLRPDGTVAGTVLAPGYRTFASGVSWSPDGTRLAVGGGAILDRSGAIVGRYAPPSTDAAVTAAPAWSPDGSTIVFDRFATAYDARTNIRYELQSDLYAAPAAGGPAVAVTRTPDLWETGATYRPGTHATRAGTAQQCVIRGTSRGDVIHGGPAGDLIFSGAGNDLVEGGGGNDLIDGGPGNDVLYGGTGRDWLLGGPGNDRLHAHDGAPDAVYGGPGRDTAWIDRRLDFVTNVERLGRG